MSKSLNLPWFKINNPRLYCSAVININNFSGVSVPARTISAITTELYLESSALDNFDDHFHNSLGILHSNESYNMTHFLLA